MKDNGPTTKQTVLVSTAMLMARDIKVSGKMIYNMVWELKHGLIHRNTKVNIVLAVSMVLELINGVMAQCTLVNGWRIKFMV